MWPESYHTEQNKQIPVFERNLKSRTLLGEATFAKITT